MIVRVTFLFLLFLLICASTNYLEAASNKKPLVVIDPGHGDFDIGARVGTIQEKVLALQTAKKVQHLLKKRGYPVVLTRIKDTFIPLAKRTQIANDTKCKLFVSIHYNAHPSPKAKGVEVFYYKKGAKWRSRKSKQIADRTLRAILSRTKAHSRGVKHGNFHVIREAKMPAILVEGGFITHLQERENLSKEVYIHSIAKGIADGIHGYFFP